MRPYHAPLVHTPIGAVVTVAVLDAVSVFDGAGHPLARELYRGATFTLMVGTGAMFLAIVAGMADRARLTAAGSRQRGGVNRHAAAMSALTVLCVVEITVRRGHFAAAASTPGAVAALSAVALVLAVLGGHSGGQLVYRGGVGVGTDTASL